jgi:hypothetical protein
MTSKELRVIRDRHAETTSGKWHVGRPDQALCRCHSGRTAGDTCYNIYAGEGEDVTSPCAGLRRSDALFIAAAHEDVAALLREVERLRQRLREFDQDARS